MNKKYIRHLIMIIVGSFLLGFSCGFLIHGAIGADALTTLDEGIFIRTGIDVGMANTLVVGSLLLVTLFFTRKHFGLGTFFYLFACSFGMSTGVKILPDPTSILGKVCFYIIGLLLLCFTVAICAKCECGKNCYDGFCFMMVEKIHQPYKVIRTVGDLIMLIVGIILGGTFGIGTIVSTFTAGTICQFMMEKVEKMHWYRSFMMLD